MIKKTVVESHGSTLVVFKPTMFHLTAHIQYFLGGKCQIINTVTISLILYVQKCVFFLCEIPLSRLHHQKRSIWKTCCEKRMLGNVD